MQAGHRVAHRGLVGRLSLRLAAQRVFGGGVAVHQGAIDLRVQSRHARVELLHALAHSGHEGAVQLLGQRAGVVAVFDSLEGLVGLLPGAPGPQDALGEDAQILQQRQLEHQGPGPQLPQGERRDRLIGLDEAGQPLDVDAPVAVTDELEGHGVDADPAGVFARSDGGQLRVVALGKIVAKRAALRFEQVEVVEQPFHRGVDGLCASHVFGELSVGGAEHPQVLLEAQDQVGADSRGLREGETARQRTGTLFEALEVQKLAPERQCRWRLTQSKDHGVMPSISGTCGPLRAKRYRRVSAQPRKKARGRPAPLLDGRADTHCRGQSAARPSIAPNLRLRLSAATARLTE